MAKMVAPYGSWRSAVSAEQASASTLSIGGISIDGAAVFWLEGRPLEGGRNVVVRWTADGGPQDVTPPGFNVRTRVHEYGGGAFLAADDMLYFANYADQRVYRQRAGEEPEPLTPAESAMRYADFRLDRRRNRLLCVREDHSGGGEAVNTLVAIDLASGGPGEILAMGYDFYATPRLSPDGERLAWLCWRHPNMPWDGTELWLADVAEDGTLENAGQIAGGPRESVFQPEWSPGGALHFVSDPTGWWNLYRLTGDQIEALYPMEAEFGQPQWVFDYPLYGFIDATTIVCAYCVNGVWRIGRLDTATRHLEELPLPYTDVMLLKTGSGQAVAYAGSPTDPWRLAQFGPRGENHRVLRIAQGDLAAEFVSIPERITFPTEGGLTARGYFYRPRNPHYAAPAGDLPPLLVLSHGGPTSSTSEVYNERIQFWTTRGFAVLDVDYRGSTGYGRAYREQLNGQWGVADLEDCAHGARYLAERGEVDGKRLAIRGSSAGGYTTLCALTFTDVFAAGASYYGVSDLAALATDSHKFESRYLDNMIGPYPERKDIYDARSPINFTDRLNCPLILFQGLEDPVVSPAQSERIYEALRSRGIPVAYVTYEGESHGFRKAENIIRSLEAELYFYGRVFGFAPADEIEPIRIENL